MKGSAITGPVAKEAAELWPVSYHSYLQSGAQMLTYYLAYCLQLRCCHVSGCLLRETVHMGGVRAAFYAQASSMIPCQKALPSSQFLLHRLSTNFEWSLVFSGNGRNTIRLWNDCTRYDIYPPLWLAQLQSACGSKRLELQSQRNVGLSTRW